MLRNGPICFTILALAALAPALSPAAAAPPIPVDFSRDVFSVFQRACLECHGPKKAEANLRLDSRAGFLKGGDSGPVVKRGQADASELIRRVRLPKGDTEVMPNRGDLLSAQEIDALRRWINAGAEWPESFQPSPHWAYLAPVRPPLPAVQTQSWPRNEIDAFILARLEREGLKPSPEADRYTFARRLYLDLIGLPPSVAEVDAFVNDKSPAAYERLVDRLLASKQFGVRWARPWLDCARYADSHGYQKDDFRDLWAYRDWVVSALNNDLPFDQFTIEQLAGDLLPNATAAQRIATGFNRCAPTNVEAGSDPEETRTSQVIDRVNTLGTVWLGTSLACAQCHDHKYDPFTQKDYYGLFAIFNNTAIEAERANPKVPGSIAFKGPTLKLDGTAESVDNSALEATLNTVKKDLAERSQALAAVDAKWERETLAAAGENSASEVLELDDFSSLGGATSETLPDHSVLVSGEIPDKDTYSFTARTALKTIHALRLDALTDDSLPGHGPGLGDAQRPNFVLNEFSVSAVSAPASKEAALDFARARADFSQNSYDVSGAIDDKPATAWAIAPQFGKPHWAVFELAQPLTVTNETVLKFKLVQNFGKSRAIGRLKITAISGSASASAPPQQVAAALKKPVAERTEAERKALVKYRESQDSRFKELTEKREELERDLKSKTSPTTLVMEELARPRNSFMLVRGNFLTPGEAIAPHTPSALPAPVASSESLNRLGLARWLVDRSNPLTARVTVNRYWAEIFGRGLVATPEDFGIKGDPPSHRELLDWLAVEFMEQGWSMKKTVRTIVLSSTYRQSSRVTLELRERDDQNRLLDRAPRFRLPAETIRDNALGIAGLVSLEQGGPSIRPYQPDGLWVKVGGQRYDYVVSAGEERYRRGLYVVCKRGSPYPSFLNFDSDNRMACRVKRSRSNTPLQALTLMNDLVYVEAAKALALRVQKEQPSAALDTRLTYAFRLAVARPPAPAELARLRTLFDSQRTAAGKNAAAANEVAKDVSLPNATNAADFAAWYAVATALLNLDETITRE